MVTLFFLSFFLFTFYDDVNFNRQRRATLTASGDLVSKRLNYSTDKTRRDNGAIKPLVKKQRRL